MKKNWDFSQFPGGYFLLANKIAEQLARISLPPSCTRVLWYIFRRTYGYGRKSDDISLNQISAATGIKRQHVHRAVQLLTAANIIKIEKKMGAAPMKIIVENNFKKWVGVTNSGNTPNVPNIGNTPKNTKPTAPNRIKQGADGASVPNSGNTSGVPNSGNTTHYIKNKYKNTKVHEVKNLNGAALKIKEIIKKYPAADELYNFFVATMDDDEIKYAPKTAAQKLSWYRAFKQCHELDEYKWWQIFDIVYFGRVESTPETAGPDGFNWKEYFKTPMWLRKKSRSMDINRIHVLYGKLKDDMHEPHEKELDYIRKEVNNYASKKG